MTTHKILILMGPVEEALRPAIDSAMRQISNGIIGIRNKKNVTKLNGLSRRGAFVEALIFAVDFGFCAKVFFKPKVIKRAKRPKKVMALETETREGWVKIEPSKTVEYYPHDMSKANEVLKKTLGFLEDLNLRETIKEGLTVVTDDVWQNLVELVKKNDQGVPEAPLSEDIPDGSLEPNRLERYFHSKRKEKKDEWIYKDVDLYAALKNHLGKKAKENESDYFCEFIAGLCAYHLSEYNNAISHFRKAYDKEYSCSWISEALAKVLFKDEKERGFKGEDEYVFELYKQILRAAPNDFPVLITGEPGTGKEIVAEEIHKYSGRKKNIFYVINIGALDGDLVNSVLFGHKKGAFTGASSDRLGAFKAAEEGTFFIDEIGNANLDVQKKLLRVIEYKEYRAVGGEKEDSKARLVFATNKDLWELVSKGKFMEDLLHRICVFHIELEPLWKHKNEILHFLGKELPEVRFDEEAHRMLKNHAWPGNFRELKSMCERTKAFDKKYIFREDIEDLLLKKKGNTSASLEAVDYNILNLQEFRGALKTLSKDEIKKYGCYQYLENNRDWKGMLKKIRGKSTSQNVGTSLSDAGLTEDNVESVCENYSFSKFINKNDAI
jgi:transcriptional regulator with AAA-type ATPase domain